MKKQDIKLEAGKSYRIKSGQRVDVYATDRGGKYPVHVGLWVVSGFKCIPSRYTIEGRFIVGSTTPRDIIGPWIEPIEFDFDILPRWCDKAIAMDQCEIWFCYDGTPSKDKHKWIADKVRAFAIPKSFAPKFKGDWKDSLFINPKYDKK